MTDAVLGPSLVEALQAGTSVFIDQWLVAEGEHLYAGRILARAGLAQALVAG